MHIFNNCAKFQIDCFKTVEGVAYPVLAITRKCSKFKKVVILSIFFPFQNTDAHLRYVCNNCAKFQTDCKKTVGEVDYTNR